MKLSLELVEMVVEPVVAELVEASKRPQKKTNEAGGFDKLSNRRIPILKIDFRVSLIVSITSICLLLDEGNSRGVDGREIIQNIRNGNIKLHHARLHIRCIHQAFFCKPFLPQPEKEQWVFL